MKNTIKVFGIITIAVIIGFSMTACSNGNDSGGGGITTTGRLILKNMDSLNGKYITAASVGSNPMLVACAAYNRENGSKIGVRISGGQATLHVFDVTKGIASMGTDYNFTDTRTVNMAFYVADDAAGNVNSVIAYSGTISFVNGYYSD